MHMSSNTTPLQSHYSIIATAAATPNPKASAPILLAALLVFAAPLAVLVPDPEDVLLDEDPFEDEPVVVALAPLNNDAPPVTTMGRKVAVSRSSGSVTV
jgi:hypothetical protein